MLKPTIEHQLTGQDLLDVAWQAFVVERKPRGWEEEHSRCSYAHGCAIGQQPWMKKEFAKIADRLGFSADVLLLSTEELNTYCDDNDEKLAEADKYALHHHIAGIRRRLRGVEPKVLIGSQLGHDSAAKSEKDFHSEIKGNFILFAHTNRLKIPGVN